VNEDGSAVEHSPWSHQGAARPVPSAPPTGWYPDPADPARQRYWDGTNWTAETRQAAPPPTDLRLKPGVTPTGAPGATMAGAPGQADPYAQSAAVWRSGYGPAATPAPGVPGPLSPGNPYATTAVPAPAAPMAYAGTGPRTADGVPLAGWWWRVLATIIDNVILNLVFGLILMQTVFSDLVPGITAWLRDVFDQAAQGLTPDTALPVDLLRRTYELTLAIAAIQVVYSVLMLVWRAGTLGQLICQLRVVPVGQGRHAGGLAFGKAVVRVAVWVALTSAITAAVDLLLPDSAAQYGFLLTIMAIAAYLWPLFNAKRQGLHDLAADTQVVRLGY